MLKILVVSLLLTLLFELPVAYAFGLRDRRGMQVAVLVNGLTNPVAVLLNWLLRTYTPWPWFVVQLPLELLAIAVEAVCYRACSETRHPVGLALCANSCSYLLGKMLNLIF